MKIMAVSGGRADWGLLSPVLKAIQHDHAFKLQVVVTGQHLIKSSSSLKNIRADGFHNPIKLDIKLTNDDSNEAIAAAMGRAVMSYSKTFTKLRPDIILILGDRYEILAAAQAALIMKIPVAHLCGGDVTEGAMDESIRHAITKMSHLHFVTNEDAARRVAQLGESKKYIYNVGSPGLDHIWTMKKMNRADFFKSIGFNPLKQNILVTFHPVTLDKNSQIQCRQMLKALSRYRDVGIILTASNADPEGQTLTKMIKAFATRHSNAVFHNSLGTTCYLNALRHVDAIVGNSSSGLYEAPSFGIPTVNIGDRQKGRLKASSVVDCKPTLIAIDQALKKALKTGRRKIKNPYGDGKAAGRIVKILKSIKNPEQLIRKKFYDR